MNVTRSQPDLLTSSHSRLPGSSPQVTSRPTRARSARRPCSHAEAGLARKQALRASGGSVSLSSYTQTQRSCYRCIYTCSSGRRKRPHRSALALCRRPCRWSHRPCTFARCCEEADLASLGWICVAEQRCTDAALVLDASTRVAAASESGLIDLQFAFVVDHADGSQAAYLHSSSTMQMGLRLRTKQHLNSQIMHIMQGYQSTDLGT